MNASLIDHNRADALLAWYDEYARDLPWREGPHSGKRADPYHVWLSEIMLQQTTVAAVKDYFTKFITLWPSLADFAKADEADIMAAWAGLGYYSRARNLVKTARIILAQYDGIFPSEAAELIKLPGIGPYTSAAIAAIAFDQRATIVDGNVERVIARMHRVKTPLPKAKSEIYALADAITPPKRAGDYAQAIMDLGATICTPKSPDCPACPWSADCAARAAECQTDYPKKLPKKPKPTRHGTAYIAQRKDGAILLETRPAKGLLGGMRAFPATEFSETAPDDAAPLNAEWITLNDQVKHVFTHFTLLLSVQIAQVDHTAKPTRGAFVTPEQFDAKALPNLMQKAWHKAAAHLTVAP